CGPSSVPGPDWRDVVQRRTFPEIPEQVRLPNASYTHRHRRVSSYVVHLFSFTMGE
ncbi:short transient receptor potential channel 4, partial [Biomphalaria pfeifferi]